MLHFTEPENFKPKFEVVGCFVEHSGRILLLHRHQDKPEGGTWCLPAGKLNAGETAVEAMIRETKEETGHAIDPSRLVYIKKTFVAYPTYQFVYHVFKTELDKRPAIALKTDEHTEHKWVTPEEALAMDLIPDEDACIKFAYGL
jgi:ADP-ribose pyrophosphatase